MEYSKLQAFQRIYFILMKKRFSILNILKSSLILILNIPFKFLKICYYFIFVNKGNIRWGLEILYINSYYLLKDSKIEILNNKIYLNCYSLGKALSKLRPNCKNLSEQQLFNFFHDLKLAAANFKSYELTNHKYLKIPLAKVITKENIEIHGYHYTYKNFSHSIHSTSNIPSKIELSQIIDPPMLSMVKHSAANPGSIISKNIQKYFPDWKRYKILSEYEIDSIKFNHLDLFDLSDENYKYIDRKHNIFKEIIIANLGQNAIEDSSFYTELRNNCYSNILINSNNSDIIEEINNYKNNIL